MVRRASRPPGASPQPGDRGTNLLPGEAGDPRWRSARSRVASCVGEPLLRVETPVHGRLRSPSGRREAGPRPLLRSVRRKALRRRPRGAGFRPGNGRQPADAVLNTAAGEGVPRPPFRSPQALRAGVGAVEDGGQPPEPLTPHLTFADRSEALPVPVLHNGRPLFGSGAESSLSSVQVWWTNSPHSFPQGVDTMRVRH